MRNVLVNDCEDNYKTTTLYKCIYSICLYTGVMIKVSIGMSHYLLTHHYPKCSLWKADSTQDVLPIMLCKHVIMADVGRINI